MSKPNKHDDKPKQNTQKVLTFFRDQGAFGFIEVEISKEDLVKHGKVISKVEPDIFAIFLSNLTKKAREIFEI